MRYLRLIKLILTGYIFYVCNSSQILIYRCQVFSHRRGNVNNMWLRMDFRNYHAIGSVYNWGNQHCFYYDPLNWMVKWIFGKNVHLCKPWPVSNDFVTITYQLSSVIIFMIYGSSLHAYSKVCCCQHEFLNVMHVSVQLLTILEGEGCIQIRCI